MPVQLRDFVRGRNKYGAKREQWTTPPWEGNICQPVPEFFIWRLWSFTILLGAVWKDLAPQTGMINLIFLKGDYFMQSKCSNYLLGLLICLLKPRTGTVTVKKGMEKLDKSNLSSLYLKSFSTILSLGFIAKVNTWLGTCPQNPEQKGHLCFHFPLLCCLTRLVPIFQGQYLQLHRAGVAISAVVLKFPGNCCKLINVLPRLFNVAFLIVRNLSLFTAKKSASLDFLCQAAWIWLEKYSFGCDVQPSSSNVDPLLNFIS